MTEAEYRAKLKKYHICVNCKTVDAYTMNGRSHCAECARKDAEKKRELLKVDANREKNNFATAKWREKMSEQGKCPRCGKKSAPNRKLCVECLAYSRQASARRRRENGTRTWDMRNEEGTCFICGKPAIAGKKMCRGCYEQRLPAAMRNLEKARANQIWKGAMA